MKPGRRVKLRVFSITLFQGVRFGRAIGDDDRRQRVGLQHRGRNCFDEPGQRLRLPPLQPQDLGDRLSDPALAGRHFLVVQYNDPNWQYDNGAGTANLSSAASDVLVATIDLDAWTILPIDAQGSLIDGISSGYAASDIAFSPDSQNDEFEVSSGYFSRTSEQATKYLYTSAINGAWQTGVVYPDSEDELQQDASGVWSFTENGDLGDHTSTDYDRTGRTISTTDQRGVVHEYSYGESGTPAAGRPTRDDATTIPGGSGVDTSVVSIVTGYDDIGRVQLVGSYSYVSGVGDPVNQIERVFDGWGNLYREYQEHDGSVDAKTPYVQYDYADGATGDEAAYLRLDQVTYPNGRQIGYNYAAGVDSIMSRLSSITDSNDVSVAYKYLGTGRIVEEDNLTVENSVPARTRLTYLDENRLVEVDDASQNILERNVYDGTNRRIQIFTDFRAARPARCRMTTTAVNRSSKAI